MFNKYKDIICACLIIKNEENNLERCLISLNKYFSQIIVIDTGSEDTSPQIALKYGVELYFNKWNNNFSSARNIALSYARKPWILSIDADEYLTDFNIDLHLLNDNKIGGFNLELINFLDSELKTFSKHRYTRLFRNNKNIFFKGSVHEQIRDSIELQNLKIIDLNINIFHTGYINTSTEKKERNRLLLENEFNNKSDDWNTYYLADTEFSLGNLNKSEELFLKILNSKILNNQQNDLIKIRLSQIYLQSDNKNRFDKIENILFFNCSSSDEEGLRMFILAASYLEQEKYLKAKELYNNKILINSGLVDKNIIEKALKIINSKLNG